MVFGLKTGTQLGSSQMHSFNSLWELDGVRTREVNKQELQELPFNSLWELDGVRTSSWYASSCEAFYFQFPVGIRWCSDVVTGFSTSADLDFQFPVGIRWCSDNPGDRCKRA